jgi:hypothetical protein
MNSQFKTNSKTAEGSATGRRSFMALVIGLIWTGISGTIGAIAVRFVAGPKSRVSSTARWTDIGALKDFATGTPTKREVVIQQDSGWGRFNSLRSVWIVKRDHETMVFPRRVRISVAPSMRLPMDSPVLATVVPGAQAATNSVVRRHAISTFWKAGSTAIR